MDAERSAAQSMQSGAAPRTRSPRCPGTRRSDPASCELSADSSECPPRKPSLAAGAHGPRGRVLTSKTTRSPSISRILIRATYGPSGPVNRHSKVPPTSASTPEGQRTSSGRNPVSRDTTSTTERSAPSGFTVLTPPHPTSRPTKHKVHREARRMGAEAYAPPQARQPARIVRFKGDVDTRFGSAIANRVNGKAQGVRRRMASKRPWLDRTSDHSREFAELAGVGDQFRDQIPRRRLRPRQRRSRTLTLSPETLVSC